MKAALWATIWYDRQFTLEALMMARIKLAEGLKKSIDGTTVNVEHMGGRV